jgi:sucrose-6-phosphate hydrolase SacC (GH32 family)
MVLVAVKCDDMAKAKAFAKDPSLKKAMQKGGVTGAPSFSFVTMTFQDTAVISSDMMSRTTFTVKDWDAWQKSFEEGRQQRLDNGITVRAYGHDPDDNKKVVLVTALTDTAKAFAWYKSDELKKRREAGGVIGEPKRFLFRVVQRY